MATAPQQRRSNGAGPVRSLRIGVILGGKIIEEKLFRKPTAITVGQSSKNTFSVPVEKLPREWTLFQPSGQGYLLQFAESMDGRVSDGKQIFTFDQLRAGPAQQKGSAWHMALSPTSRGKITLGELTVLFQFVNAPPVQPRPKLPASVRGGVADRIDPVLAVMVGLSVALHGGFAWWLYHRDIQSKTKLEMISAAVDLEPERQAQLFTLPQKPAEPAPTAESPSEDKGKGDDESDKKPKRPSTGERDDDENGEGPSEAAIAEAVEDTAVIRVLTGGAGGGSRYSEMSGKDPGGDLDKSLKNVGATGGKVTSRGEGGLGTGTRGPSTGEIGTGTGPGVEGPGDTGRVGGDKGEAKISSRTSVGSVEDLGEADLDPAEVANTIRRRYIKGVQRCHEQLLKTDPRGGGKVEIEITIGKVGKVVRANVNGFDRGVDECIKALALQWRFPVPKSDDGKPTEATFIMPFILRAGG
jgi:hypothetical protein